ncbi:MAG: histidine kinase [Acidimicrobiales bacterium]
MAIACRVLAGWPHHTLLVAGAASITIPLALVAASTPLVSRVDRLLVATVSITGLTGVVVGVYVLVVVGLGRTATGDERQLLILSMLAAAVAVLLYLPARARLAEVANRMVYGERHAPDESIKAFGSRLSRAIPMDELLLQLAESLKKTMDLTSAEVWTGSEGRYDLAVSVPDRPVASMRIEAAALDVVARAGVSGTAWVGVWLPHLLDTRAGQQVRVVPISHSGELLGLFVLDRPVEHDPFGEADDTALTELVRQVGLALHNVQLDSALQASLDDVRRYAGELQASRARIVATGDAERRKIERNLHDGAQQHLVALAVNLRLVGDLLQDDPSTAAEMMAMLADSVKDTIQELRDLAHGIYPPLLMDSGLPEALPAAANRSPLEVVAEVSVGRFPTEVEAAVYFCCLEALQNAAKHAPDATVHLRVWEDKAEHRLHFEVRDDGPGFDVTAATAGHGYVNMSDRLGAIGGEVSWTSAPGEGATVAGWVPLP